jgi:hypothetical protein
MLHLVLVQNVAVRAAFGALGQYILLSEKTLGMPVPTRSLYIPPKCCKGNGSHKRAHHFIRIRTLLSRNSDLRGPPRHTLPGGVMSTAGPCSRSIPCRPHLAASLDGWSPALPGHPHAGKRAGMLLAALALAGGQPVAKLTLILGCAAVDRPTAIRSSLHTCPCTQGSPTPCSNP